MIPILLFAKGYYVKNRPGYQQRVHADPDFGNKPYLDSRMAAVESAVENELLLANLDENTHTGLLRNLKKAIRTHGPVADRMTDRNMAVVDILITGKTEVKK